MNTYLLDTHILIWLLDNDARLSSNVREDIDYFQHAYYVSVETLREIIILQSLKKITLDYDLDKIIARLQEQQIQIVPIEIHHLKTLEKLPIVKVSGSAHNDPFDRMLIAQTIANNYTLISSDHKFPFYKKHGLHLLVNEH